MLNFFKKIFSNLLFKIVLALLLGIFAPVYLSDRVISFFYSISCCLKDFLLFFLPFVIFGYLSYAITAEKDSPKIVLCTFLFVIVSTIIALFFSYFMGVNFLPSIIPEEKVKNITIALVNRDIEQLWKISLFFIPTDKAMFFSLTFSLWFHFICGSYISRIRSSFYNKLEGSNLGIVQELFVSVTSLGIFATSKSINVIKKAIVLLKNFAEDLLVKVFVPLIPLYILGFVMKIFAENLGSNFFGVFFDVFLFTLGSILLFLFFAFLIISKFRIDDAFTYFKNFFPAAVVGFSTMSSIATMPLTIQCVEKCSSKKNLTKIIIPTTVNIQAVGDLINIVISSLALLFIFSGSVPSFSNYCLFVVYACIAQFSCVSVPGGGIIVMTGILQKYLGLSIEATTLLTSIYFLQEPFLTAANVSYNGAFAIFLEKFFKKRT